MSRLIFLTLCALALSACDSDPAETPTAGSLTVSISTPNPMESAMLVRITGPGISDARAVSTDHVLHVSDHAPGEFQAIILGDLTSGPLMRFDVPDIAALQKYSAEILQVASPNYDLREDSGQYGITLAPH